MSKLPHIQGMRGLAILLIIVFHLLPDLCPNGYIGVDVFLIISGYFLIGPQLVDGAEFSPLKFLQKKSSSILAPYFGVIALITIATIVFFHAVEIRNNAGLLKACLIGEANLFLDQHRGNYFTTDTRNYPLMHLWYMGVTLQCYLIFMLLFTGWNKFRCGRRVRIATLFVIGVVSFAISILYHWKLPYDYANDTYYWSSARIWEFIIGGLLFILPKPRHSIFSQCILVFASLALIVSSFVTLPCSSIGICIGALCGCCMLYYGNIGDKYSPQKHLLQNSFLINIGDLSYYLYLIHWPCICFCEYLLGHPMGICSAIGLSAIIIPLSWLHKYIFHGRHISLKLTFSLFLVSAALHRGNVYTNGFRDYLHQEINCVLQGNSEVKHNIPKLPSDSHQYIGTEGIMPNNFTPTPTSKSVLLQEIGHNSQQPNFVLMGDSHALNLALGMHTLAMRNGWHGLYLNTYVTPFWDAEFETDPSIAIGNFFNEDKANRIMAWLEAHPELHTIFIAQYWTLRLTTHKSWTGEIKTGDALQVRTEELKEFCLRLQKMGKEVVLMTDQPTLSTKSPTRLIASYLMWHKGNDIPSSLMVTRYDYEQANGAINHELDKLEELGLCKVIHRENAFFKTDSFCSYDGRYMSHSDDNHLTAEGAVLSLSCSVEMIKSLLNTPRNESINP